MPNPRWYFHQPLKMRQAPLLLPDSNRHNHAVCEVAVQVPIAVAELPAPLATCCVVHLVPEGLSVVFAKIDRVPDAAGFRDSAVELQPSTFEFCA